MNRVLTLLAAAFLGLAGTAQAETAYPTRPITIVVPLAAGGATDIAARLLADELSKIWKVPVLVDNKPGGGTIIGTAAVANAPADGYTFGVQGFSFGVNPAVRNDLPYDTLKQFMGISVMLDSPHAIVAHPGFAPNNLKELIEEAKKRPADKPLTFATSGLGGGTHMLGEMIQWKTGIKLQHVPYPGNAAALPDVLAGRIDFFPAAWTDVRPHVESGKLKLLGISYRTRLPETPDTPLLSESLPELKGLPAGAWVMMMARRGIPDDVAQKIQAGVMEALSSKAYKDKILELGSYPRAMTIKETDEFLRNEVDTWTKIAKAANITVQ